MDYFDRDGKPCKACFSYEDMMKQSEKFARKQENVKLNPTEKEIQQKLANRRKDCPIDKDELGRSTWNLLHTMAAYYPEQPKSEEKKNMQEAITAISKTYPCSHCAEDFRQDIKQNPPKLENNEELSRWMCEAHNRVNEKLGKDLFDCGKVRERWLDGWKDGSCDP